MVTEHHLRRLGCRKCTKPHPLLGRDTDTPVPIEQRRRVEEQTSDLSVPLRKDPSRKPPKIDPMKPCRSHRAKLEIDPIDEHVNEQPRALIAHANSFPRRVETQSLEGRID
jgi:hypothetical protein